MEYTGNFKTMFSEICGENVAILKYKSKDKAPYCDCTRCGKPIKRIMYVVQSNDTGIELMYLGSDCVKKFR